MVICKYYQQGTCRFGSNCRFDHSGDYYSPGDSPFRGRFGGNQYATNNFYQGKNTYYKIGNTSHDLEEIMRMVIQEVIQSDKGGQWPLSCFAPIKERPCFPGFEDYSPEEIRWKMYESLQNGTFPDCQRQVKILYDVAKSQRSYILNQKEEVLKIVEKLLSGQKVETESNFSFVQAASQANDNKFLLWGSPGYGQDQQQNSASNNFTFALPQLGGGSAQPTFQQSPILFSGNLQPIPSANNHPSNVFGNSTQTQAPFSSSVGLPVVQERSVFEQPAQSAVSSNVFDVNKSVLNTATQPTMNWINPQVNKSILNTPSTVNWNNSQNTVADSSLYTPSTEFSQHELDAFNAQTFTMGKVPTKPPPKELCTT